MSDDLISRQAAIYIIQQLYPGIPRVKLLQKEWQKRYEPYIRVENAIRELPSAQKEGEWIKIKSDDGTICSNCGFTLEDWIREHCYAEGFVNVRNVCEKHYDFGNVDDDWFCADGKER